MRRPFPYKGDSAVDTVLGRHNTFVDPTYRGDNAVTAPKHYAYNLTSECFLGLDVDAADFSPVLLEERIPSLTPESGAGLWMVPFRGISAAQARIALDLVYLDESHRVIAVVESFPQSTISSSMRPAASVLALPVSSIQSSQTKPGDQLVLCPAKEMATRLSQLHISGKLERTQPENARPRTETAVSSSQTESEPHPQAPPTESAAQSAPPRKKKTGNWLERFLSPKPSDLRRAPRRLVPGVFAFYWTGAAPLPHAIKDISASGLYLVTEERWYPATVIRLTLTKTDGRGIERSISVQAQVVRWGNDGVGLQFVTPQASGRTDSAEAEGANRDQLDAFLHWIGNGNA